MRSLVRRSSLVAVVGLSLAASALAGCSSANETGSAAASAESTGVTSSATALVTGVAGAVLQGVTDDGMVAYTVGTNAWMVPLAGGAPTAIGSCAFMFPEVVVSHGLVFVWTTQLTKAEGATEKATWQLTMFGKSLPAPVVLSQSSAPLYATASADSSSIAYFTDVVIAPVDQPGTLMGANVSSLDKPVVVQTNVATSVEDSAYPTLSFAGAGAASELVAVVEAGSKSKLDNPADQVLMAPTSSWAPTRITTNGLQATTVQTSADDASFAYSTENALYVSSGGAPTLVSDASTNDSFGIYDLAASGDFLLYISTGGALSRLPVGGDGGAATVLVPASGLSSVDEIAADEKSALVMTYSSKTSTRSVALVQTGAASTPVSFGASSWEISGSHFSADSKYALALVTPREIRAKDFSGYRGALAFLPTDGSATTPTVLTTNTLEMTDELVSNDVNALTGSVVAFVDNATINAAKSYAADLTIADLSKPATKTVLVSGASPRYFVTADKTQLVYVVNDGSAQSGVYSIAVPAL